MSVLVAASNMAGFHSNMKASAAITSPSLQSGTPSKLSCGMLNSTTFPASFDDNDDDNMTSPSPSGKDSYMEDCDISTSTCRRQTDSTIATTTSSCQDSTVAAAAPAVKTPPSPTPDLSYLDFDYEPAAPARPDPSATNGHTDTFPYPSPDSASFSTRTSSHARGQSTPNGSSLHSPGATMSDAGSLWGGASSPADDSDGEIEDGFAQIAFGSCLSAQVRPDSPRAQSEGGVDREMATVTRNFENVSLELNNTHSHIRPTLPVRAATPTPIGSNGFGNPALGSSLSRSSSARRSSTPTFLAALTSSTSQKKNLFNLPNINLSFGKSSSRQDRISFTRPRQLPPKSAKEERKHLQQYESIRKSFTKSQRQESQRQRKLNESDHQRKSRELRQWKEYVLPNFGRRNVNRRVQGIWWHGIPPSLRGEVWRMVMIEYGGMGGDLYQTSLKRAEMLFKGKDAQFTVNHVMPELRMFQEDCPCYQDLVNVANAFLTAKSSDSTLLNAKPGILWLMATFCINLVPEEAFKATLFVAGQKVWHAFFENGKERHKLGKQFSVRVRDQLSEVFFELILREVDLNDVLTVWFESMFSAHMPIDLSHRLLDLYYLHGESLLFHIALALLTLRKPDILSAGSHDGIWKALTDTTVREGEERRVLELVAAGVREGWHVDVGP